MRSRATGIAKPLRDNRLIRLSGYLWNLGNEHIQERCTNVREVQTMEQVDIIAEFHKGYTKPEDWQDFLKVPMDIVTRTLTGKNTVTPSLLHTLIHTTHLWKSSTSG